MDGLPVLVEDLIGDDRCVPESDPGAEPIITVRDELDFRRNLSGCRNRNPQ